MSLLYMSEVSQDSISTILYCDSCMNNLMIYSQMSTAIALKMANVKLG